MGVRLSEAGRLEEALAATEESVDIRRRLAQVSPAAFEPDLARSLTNLGSRLSEVGRREEALTITREAVTLFRQLAQRRPAAFAPSLGASLDNLGIRLSETGRRKEALTGRRRGGADPAPAGPVQSGRVRPRPCQVAEQHGRPAGKSGTSARSADCHRGGGADPAAAGPASPAAFDQDLAIAVENLGIRLAVLGRRDEALAAINEAATMCRCLTNTNPITFNPDLARSLRTFASVLVILRTDPAGAYRSISESVVLYRQMAKQSAALSGDLGEALGTAATVLNRLGQRKDVSLVRRLVKAGALDEAAALLQGTEVLADRPPAR
jgi:tetratricopeptide (TPR) repeat protein